MVSRQLTLPKLLIVQQTLNRGAGCAPARHQLYWFQRLSAVLLVTVLLQSCVEQLTSHTDITAVITNV